MSWKLESVYWVSSKVYSEKSRDSEDIVFVAQKKIL